MRESDKMSLSRGGGLLFFGRQGFDFYGHLSEQAEKTLECLDALRDFLEDPNPVKSLRVGESAKQVEGLRGIIVEALDGSGAEPPESGDVLALSRALQETAERAGKAAGDAALFDVGPDKSLRELARLVREECAELAAAVRSLKEDSRACEEHILNAKKSGNRAEVVYREALAELFKNPNAVSVIKLRELYRHLSDSAQKGDEAAGVVGDILVKSA